MHANSKIPTANKQLAQQQYENILAACHSIITDWVAATCSSDAFAVLQPAMQQLAPSITESVVTAAEGLVQIRSVEAGKLMEAAAVEVRREITYVHVKGSVTQ